MQALANGKPEGAIPSVGRGEEVGKMAVTVQIFKDSAVRVRELEKSEAATQARAGAERRAAMEELADDFECSVNGIVRTLSTAATGLQSMAQSMTSSASNASKARRNRQRRLARRSPTRPRRRPRRSRGKSRPCSNRPMTPSQRSAASHR
jgi:hypothetical protein